MKLEGDEIGPWDSLIDEQMPETIAVTEKEGGAWIDWDRNWQDRPRTVHAIKFDNGRIWDAVNGWRPKKPF